MSAAETGPENVPVLITLPREGYRFEIEAALKSFPFSRAKFQIEPGNPETLHFGGIYDVIWVHLHPYLTYILTGGSIVLGTLIKKTTEDLYSHLKNRLFGPKKSSEHFLPKQQELTKWLIELVVRLSTNEHKLPALSEHIGLRVYIAEAEGRKVALRLTVANREKNGETIEASESQISHTVIRQLKPLEHVVLVVSRYLRKRYPDTSIEGWIGPAQKECYWAISTGARIPELLICDSFGNLTQHAASAPELPKDHSAWKALRKSPPLIGDHGDKVVHWRDCAAVLGKNKSQFQTMLSEKESRQKGFEHCLICFDNG
jgi:hypothetical protein